MRKFTAENAEENPKLKCKMKIDGFVKSRHSRAGGNPESANQLKSLDSRFHGNDEKRPFQTFYEIIKIGYSVNANNPLLVMIFLFDSIFSLCSLCSLW